MSNEIFYTRDGLSQNERSIPALSEKYFLLSPEKLLSLVILSVNSSNAKHYATNKK